MPFDRRKILGVGQDEADSEGDEAEADASKRSTNRDDRLTTLEEIHR